MEYYIVEQDDTLDSISHKFNVLVSSLRSLNSMEILPPPGSRIVIRAPELSLTNEVYYFTRLGKVKGMLTITEHVIVFDPFRQGDSCEILTDKGKGLGDAGVFQAFIDLSDVISCNVIELQESMSSRSSGQVFVLEFMLSRTGREKRGKRSAIPKVNVYFKLANVLESGESLQYIYLKTKTDQVLALVLSSLASVDREREDSGTYVPYYEINKGYLGRINSGFEEEDDNDEEFKECVREMMEGQEQQQSSYEVPSLTTTSKVLSDKMIAQIHMCLPSVLQNKTWNLVYSTDKSGRNLNQFYRLGKDCGPNVLVVKDSEGFVFGGYFTNSWEVRNKSYGTGECYVFTFRNGERIKTYYSTLMNTIYMMSDDQSLIVGGGGNSCLLLDKYFETGSSGKSKTFNNQVLSSSEGFTILHVELWGFI